MSRLLVYIGRLALMLFAYAAAALAASAFIHAIFLGSVGFEPQDAPWLVTGSLVFSIPFVALFIAYFAFVPSAVAIGIAEAMGARDWLYYAVAGAIVGGSVIAMFWYSTPAPILFDDMAPTEFSHEPLDNPYVMLAVIGGGMVGGIAYWAIAGRGAGGWRSRPISPAR